MRRNQEAEERAVESTDNRAFLLTGCTGLVGRFLLAGLLKRGCNVAVLVRDTHTGTPAQRVEQSLQQFEQTNWLPRPRVIAATLGSAPLKLPATDVAWLDQWDLQVIHCAASIRFKTDEAGEPYRTNVDGTRHLLDLCRDLPVSVFHHVSTAYVHRGDQQAPEQAVLTDQVGGNDYECSKIQAERLLGDCAWIPQKVVHRPSIVIGDSQSGYTSTYHGFYAPLQIGAQFAKTLGFSSAAGDWFRSGLGIRPQDSKNLVPVDWVAESILEVATRPAEDLNHGNKNDDLFLHWTNPTPVRCQEMQAAIVDAIQRHFPDAAPAQQDQSEPSNGRANLLDSFRDQMQVYESYFGNDPSFDTSSSTQASSTIRCPEVNRELLGRMADFALQQNFGWPKSPLPDLPHQDVIAALYGLPQISTENTSDDILQLKLVGPGSVPSLYFSRPQSSWSHVDRTVAKPTIQLTIPLAALARCITGTTEISGLIEQGQASIGGCVRSTCSAIVADWVNDVKSNFLKN